MTGYSAGGQRMGHHQVGTLGAALAVVVATGWGCTTDIAPIGSNARTLDSGGESGSADQGPAAGGDSGEGEGGSGNANTGGQTGPGAGTGSAPPMGGTCDD